MKDYAFYSGLGFQMLGIILIFAGLGHYLDQKFSLPKNLFVIIFSLLGIGLAMFFIIYQINKKSNDKKDK